MKSKHTLDPETVLHVTDPKRARHDQQEAMASLHRPTPPMFFDAVRAEHQAAATPAAPAEEQPVTKAAGAPQGRRWPRTWKLVAVSGLVAVLAAPLTLLVLEWRTREFGGRPATSAAAGMPSATASAAPAATAVPATTAEAPRNAPVPSATTAAPSTTAREPAPRRQKPQHKSTSTPDAGVEQPTISPDFVQP